MNVGEAFAGESEEARVCVLGPTTVGAASVTGRQRSLLAALALFGSRGAAIDELADAVWAGMPPAAARSSLQNQMTRLRRAHGADLIECEHATYRLGPPTDVEGFEAALESSRELPAGDPRIRRLADALSMWRGVPFQDLSENHMADVERTRLLELRGEATELLAVARITISDLDRAVVELRAEIQRDPFRDRTWELLFVALQRAGRPGEAIAAHRDHVARLRAELGADPSAHLVELGRALTRGEPLDFGECRPPARPVAGRSTVEWGHGRHHHRCRVHRSRPAHPGR